MSLLTSIILEALPALYQVGYINVIPTEQSSCPKLHRTAWLSQGLHSHYGVWWQPGLRPFASLSTTLACSLLPVPLEKKGLGEYHWSTTHSLHLPGVAPHYSPEEQGGREGGREGLR